MSSIPKDYLKEEIRNDFLVTTMRKKVWQKEIGCFEQFQRICDKYNLKYFAFAGTLLGAVRHQGFIPWDDDMDLMMPRRDYEIFLSVANNELRQPYVLQCHLQEDDFYCGFSRIRDSNTTALIPGQWSPRTNINHGIFIDIFPFDSLPDNWILRNFHAIVGKALSVICNGKMFDLSLKPKNLKQWIINFCRMILRIIPVRLAVKWRDNWISKYNDKNQKQVGLISMFYGCERWVWDKQDIINSKYVPFEYASISIPTGFDNILKKTYGDWKVPIKGGSLHEGIFFDPDTPFTCYLKNYCQ